MLPAAVLLAIPILASSALAVGLKAVAEAGALQEARRLVLGLGTVLGGGTQGTEPSQLSEALLQHLHRAGLGEGAAEANDHAFSKVGKNEQEDLQRRAPAWPCGVLHRDEGNVALSAHRAAVWHATAWLRRCGVRGVQGTWPRDDAEWSVLRSKTAAAVGSLASIRSDNASLLCAQGIAPVVQGGVGDIATGAVTGRAEENSDANHREGTPDADASGDEGDDDMAESTASPLIRCPRCGHAVAASRAVQVELLGLRNRLLAGQSPEEASLLPRADLAKDAACVATERSEEAQLAAAWASGEDGALVAAAELFHCGACELAGLEYFLARHGDGQDGLREEARTAAACLVVVKCAAETPEFVSTERLVRDVRRLEVALWRGIGFPSLQEAAARRMVGLLRAGRLSQAGLASQLCHEGAADQRPALHRLGLRFSEPDPFGGTGSTDSVWDIEREALNRWGGVDDTKDRWDPLQLGMVYLDMALIVDQAMQVAVGLANAALWFREAARSLDGRGEHRWLAQHASWALSAPSAIRSALVDAVGKIVDTAHAISTALLAPGPQLVVLSACAAALRLMPTAGSAPAGTVTDRWLASASRRTILALARHNPFWSPPVIPLADTAGIGAIAMHLHVAYATQLVTVDPHELSDIPEVGVSAALGLYHAARAASNKAEALRLRPAVMGMALGAIAGRRVPWRAVEISLQGGWGADPLQRGPRWHGGRLDEPEGFRQDMFVAVRGLRVDLDTGSASVVLERPHVQSRVVVGPQNSYFSVVDAVAVLALGPTGGPAPTVSLQQPGQSWDLDHFLWHGRHPFQHVVVSPGEVQDAVTRPLLRAALALQSLAAGAVELSARAPFPTRECCGATGTIRRGGPHLSDALLTAGREAGAAAAEWGVAETSLRLQCAETPHTVRHDARTNVLELRLGAPHLVASAVSQTPEERSGSLPLHRLAAALEEQHPSRWVELAPLRQLCALRAAAMLLDAGSQSWEGALTTSGNEGAGPGGAAAEPVSHLLPTPERVSPFTWLDRLAEVHASLLRDLGFSSLDPGTCWDTEFTFGKCCSVGDFAEECWRQGFLEERCCLGPRASTSLEDAPAAGKLAARQLLHLACPTLEPPSVIVPAVTSWLRHPTGRGVDGRTLSAAVVDLLDKEARGCNAARKLTQDGDRQHTAAARGHAGTAVIDKWVPGLEPVGGGRALEITVSLEAQQPDAKSSSDHQDGIGWQDMYNDGVGIVALSVDELRRQAWMPRQSPELVEVASAAPEVRALHLLAAHLDKMRPRAAGGHNPSPGGPSPTVDDAGWITLETRETAALQVGQTLRITRSSGSPGATVFEEGQVLGVRRTRPNQVITMAAGEARLLHRVLLPERGKVAYYDLSQPGWVVAVPRAAPYSGVASEGGGVPTPGVDGGGRGGGSGASLSSDGGNAVAWPDCIRPSETIRGLSGAGLFVNLVGFGIATGCFRDDCSHSDHFSCGSPATCAQICASILACRYWSFWPSRSGGVCWLRRNDLHRAPMVGSMAAGADCIPPVAAGRGSRRAAARSGLAKEATLFELARGQWGLGPQHPFHQWDIVKVLEMFGRMTPSQVQMQTSGILQRSALRFARRAQRTTW